MAKIVKKAAHSKPVTRTKSVAKKVDEPKKAGLITLDDLIKDMQNHWENRKNDPRPATARLPLALANSIIRSVNDGNVDTDLEGDELQEYVYNAMDIETEAAPVRGKK